MSASVIVITNDEAAVQFFSMLGELNNAILSHSALFKGNQERDDE
jgi:hypothetical protein